MKTRSRLLSLLCAAGLLIAGCSSQVAGTPQGATGAIANTAQSSASETASAAPGNSSAGAEASTGSGDSNGATDAVDTSAATDLTLPSDLTMPSGVFPTDLSDLASIPGLDPGCLAAAGIAMGFGMLMLAPIMGGQQVTADDVNQAFSDLGEVPPELKETVDVLHKAAVAATGQPLTKAAEILGTPEVTKAMDTLSKYSDAKCGGNN